MRNTKVVSLEEAIRRSGLKDGMTISFHHHFRGGDKVVGQDNHVVGVLGVRKSVTERSADRLSVLAAGATGSVTQLIT